MGGRRHGRFVFFFGLGYGASFSRHRCDGATPGGARRRDRMVMFMLAWDGACRRLDRRVTGVTRRRDPHSEW